MFLVSVPTDVCCYAIDTVPCIDDVRFWWRKARHPGACTSLPRANAVFPCARTSYRKILEVRQTTQLQVPGAEAPTARSNWRFLELRNFSGRRVCLSGLEMEGRMEETEESKGKTVGPG